MGTKAVSNYRKRRKENLVKICGGKCNICGYDKTYSALEFHHINPNEKDFAPSKGGYCRDLNTELNEIKKCILVCANCHREIHDGLISEQELYEKKQYNQEIANQLIEDKKQLEEKKIIYCSECGKEISRYSKTGLCQSCLAKARRVVERPNREELKKLIRTIPFLQIANQYGVSDKTISKWCQSMGLPHKKKDIKQYTDEQWESV